MAVHAMDGIRTRKTPIIAVTPSVADFLAAQRREMLVRQRPAAASSKAVSSEEVELLQSAICEVAANAAGVAAVACPTDGMSEEEEIATINYGTLYRFFRTPRIGSRRIRNRLVQKQGICNISLKNVPKQRRKYFRLGRLFSVLCSFVTCLEFCSVIEEKKPSTQQSICM